MNTFNKEEFLMLKERYNPNAFEKKVEVEIKDSRYFNQLKEYLEIDRRGEVVFLVERPNGKFVLVTSEEYPSGVFRVPTGGISHGEDILESLYREVYEELGLYVDLESFVGVNKIAFTKEGEHLWFYSYLFHMKETGGNILIDATDDEVSEVFEADGSHIKAYGENLLNLQFNRADWGKFRYVSTSAAAEYVLNLVQKD